MSLLFSRLLRRDACGDVDASERVDQLECLLDVTAILSRPEPPERTLNDALDALVRRTGVTRASLREPNAEGVLTVLAAAGTSMIQHPPTPVRGPGSDTWLSFAEGRIVVDNDHTPGGRSGRDIGRGGNRATLSIPLLAGGICRGVLHLGSIHRGFFTPARVEFLVSVAQRMGATLETARLRVDLERHLSRALEAEARQRVIVNSAGEGIAETAPDGRFLFANPALCRLFGYTAAEMLGRSAHELLHHSYEDGRPMPLAECTVERSLAAQPPGAPVEDVFWRKDGTPVPVRLLFTEAEEPSAERGTIAVVHDLTNEREAERRRDAFVAAASHELRTPMTSVLGYAELLKVRPLDEAQWRRWASMIHDDATQMSDIIADMLNVTRVQSGAVDLHLEPVDLLEAARDAVASIPEAAGRVDVSGPEDAHVEADRLKLRQVISNLVENAIKYSPAGSAVRVSIERRDGAVQLSVQDRGMGIAPKDRALLFQPFGRVRNEQTAAIRGTGFGLYLVRTLVGQMQGSAWVESELGTGSRFFVHLPAAAHI